MIELNQLRRFTIVAEELNFGLAAVLLHRGRRPCAAKTGHLSVALDSKIYAAELSAKTGFQACIFQFNACRPASVRFTDPSLSVCRAKQHPVSVPDRARGSSLPRLTRRPCPTLERLCVDAEQLTVQLAANGRAICCRHLTQSRHFGIYAPAILINAIFGFDGHRFRYYYQLQFGADGRVAPTLIGQLAGCQGCRADMTLASGRSFPHSESDN
jgi:hypothetical protein